ncbi:restriction endonuclease subunit S [Convivina intestini]|uniref:restriction endonuclease subunit S n=1 Tax=Convivina intestini TaxID=1505726 RepID=UPI00200C4891|nr:restriction endonuclease subunit S [Convivina intestini]CAH1855435.1 hypothetical protein R077811_01058 [Convivina intestini]
MTNVRDSDRSYPRIRFNGYSDAWQKRKLGEVARIVGGGTPSTKNQEFWNGDIDWYSPAEINTQIYVNKSQKTITELGLKKSSAQLLPKGTVLFTSRAGIGKTAILSREGTTNQGFQSIIPTLNQLNNYFIFSQTYKLKHYGEINGAGSTFVEVSGKQMAKMPLHVPSITEQTQIGTLFQSLDNLITVNQRKVEKYQTLKKALLQRMFVSGGSDIPQIRFNGYSEAWQKRKLGNISPLRGGFAFQSSQFVPNGIPVVRISNILSEGKVGGDYLFYSEHQRDEKYRLPNGSWLLAMSGATTGKVAKLTFKAYEKYYQNQRVGYFQIQKDTNYNFIGVLVSSNLFLNQLKTVLVSGAQPNISSKDVDNFEFNIPSELSEQAKIGILFQFLDNLITVNQRKVETYKELKKALLQQMFV